MRRVRWKHNLFTCKLLHFPQVRYILSRWHTNIKVTKFIASTELKKKTYLIFQYLNDFD